MTLAQLALYLGGTLVGGSADTPISGIAGLDMVSEDEVTYVMHERLLEEAEASPALAIIAPEHLTESSKPLILVSDPRVAFSKALSYFDWRRPPLPGIHPSAVVSPTAVIHPRAHIGALAIISDGVIIGEGSVVYPHAVIDNHVEIGKKCTIHAHVAIYARCKIGDRVTIHSGAVIGADGFGYNPGQNGWEKIPHLGTVIIEDDAEIGANTTIDRATTGETLIGQGAKIDNLVMIAHNCKIGPRCIIVGQVGVAGSSVLESDIMVGGQAGISDHRHIGAGAVVAGRSGVSRDVAPGVMVSGYPAQPHLDELKYEAALRKVPKLLETVKQLEKRINELAQQVTDEKAAVCSK